MKQYSFSASKYQRAKVRDLMCAYCGNGPGCDPAHLTPRSQGGCDDWGCVIALCRTHHREFDEGRLDLEPILALSRYTAERSHMAEHMSFARCIQRLNGHAA